VCFWKAIGAVALLAACVAAAALLSGKGSSGRLSSPFAPAVGDSSKVVFLAAATPSWRLMLDCGSSGTRLKIFKLEGSNIEDVHLEEKVGMDALTSYVGRLDDLENDLRDVIEKSKQYVPEANRAQTPLTMYATAGMRILPAEDQNAVFSQCATLLSDSSFAPYHFEDARTISGEMEAAFEYLSVNYAKSGIDFPAETTGQIEMGGASLQVAFKPQENVLDHSWAYDIMGKREMIYATSYMGYGQNVARQKAQEAAVRAEKGRHLGLSRRLKTNASSATSQPRALVGGVPFPCFLKGYSEKAKVFEGTPEEQEVLIEGSSDFEGCSKLTQQILHTEYECDLPPCAIHGDYMTKISGKFVGISGFKFALLDLGLDLASTTPGQLRGAVQTFCGQKFADLGGNTKFTKYGCFLGSYAYSTLHAFGFADDSTNITFAGDYSWTLGAVMYEAFAPGSAPSGTSAERRRLLELPGVQSVLPLDHKCYWACRSKQRCAELPASSGSQCKQACSAGCATA